MNQRQRRTSATPHHRSSGCMCAALTIFCAQCSLRLLISRNGKQETIEYDVMDWEQLCKRKGLTTPSLCQISQDSRPWALHSCTPQQYSG
jgi:hypothetical protein